MKNENEQNEQRLRVMMDEQNKHTGYWYLPLLLLDTIGQANVILCNTITNDEIF